MIPEENMDMPASQPANQPLIALTTPDYMSLSNLNKFITKHLYMVHKIMIHDLKTNCDIIHNSCWDKIKSTLYTSDSSQEIDHLIRPAIYRLLQCTDTHYNRLIGAQYQMIEQHIVDTYHKTNNTNNPATTERNMLISLTNLFHQLNERMPTHTITQISNDKMETHNPATSLTVETPNTELTTTDGDDSSTDTPNNNDNHNDNMSNNKNNRKSLKDRNKNSTHTPEQCTSHNCYRCAVHNIVNLSDIQLTKTQILLLNRGLSFVPTAHNSTPMELIKDFNIFANKAKRKLRQMINPPRPPRPNEEPALFRKPTTTTTTSQLLGPRLIEDMFETIKLETSKLEQHATTQHNLTRKERLALKELASNHNLIINKADKGSTIVIRHRHDYIAEGLEHLSDTNTYLKLDGDYTTEVTKIISNTLHKLRTQGLLSPRMTEYCLPPTTPRTALIYFLKKIHKTPMGIRPIVSTVNSPTANLAEFLDHYLQPIMQGLPAYLKDTTQFLKEITEIETTRHTWLVTVDVKSLYTNIPNDEGIQACYEAWLQQEPRDNRPTTSTGGNAETPTRVGTQT